MSEKKEALWTLSRPGHDDIVFRSRISARRYREKHPGLYPPPKRAKWGPEHQKGR